MKSQRSIKNYFISPRQQIIFASFTWIAIFLGVGLHTLLILKKIREVSDANGGGFGNELEVAYFALGSFLVTVLIVGLFTFVLNIILTHRVFGSLIAIENYFKDLIAGKDRGPLTTRKYDETKSLVAVLNEYLNKNKGSH